MDLMEQIRLEATKYAAEFENACQSRDEDCGKIAPAFQSGAQALLNLLGRSATSEGHPPRLVAGISGGIVTARRIRASGEENTPLDSIWVPLSEHQALRAADLLEIERMKSDMAARRERHKELAEMYHAERSRLVEARKLIFAERSRNARLTAALKEISNFYLHEDGRIGGRAKEIASEALSEAGKDFSGDRPLPSVWIDPDKLARYPEVPAWPAHKHKENEHLIEYVPISRLRSEE